LRIQSKLMMMPVDPTIGNVEKNLFGNQSNRVIYIKETIKEIERRHQFKILGDY
jgi:hypothetical protein